MDYETYIPPNKTSTLKYSELYSTPKTSQYPELYLMTPGQYDEALFPVDTPNFIPSPSPAADFKQCSQPEIKQDVSGNASGMDFLFSGNGNEFDLNSLLSLPAPPNKDAENSYMMGSDPLNLLEFQATLDGLEFIDAASLTSTLPDGIHYWNGLQKDIPEQPQTIDDPIMTNLPVKFKIPPVDAPSSDHSATAGSTLLPMQLGGLSEVIPAGELSPQSEDSVVPSHSPATSMNWGEHRDLFERTFDLSDLAGDYMFPPPNKRQVDSPSTQFRPPEKNLLFPSPTPPIYCDTPSPTGESLTASPIPEKQFDESDRDTKNKIKPTLLFGKHEGEIIHKLLAINNDVRSKPIARDKLITIPVEEFNQLLDEAQLTEIEIAFMKEWRRRGKNKAAAQVARKRKREEVSGLDEEVQKMRHQKVELEKRCDQLQSLVRTLKERNMAAEDRLFEKHSEATVEPVSRKTHLIHVTDDEKLLLIPRVSSKVFVVKS